MANLRAVEDQEPWRLVDEDTDQHSHPLFRMSPGMEVLGAEERKNQTLLKREREILKKRNPIFPGNNTDNISKCGDIHEPPTVTSHMGRRRMVGERTRKHGPRTSLQVVSSDTSRRAGPDKTRACTATTQNRWKAARN